MANDPKIHNEETVVAGSAKAPVQAKPAAEDKKEKDKKWKGVLIGGVFGVLLGGGTLVAVNAFANQADGGEDPGADPGDDAGADAAAATGSAGGAHWGHAAILDHTEAPVATSVDNDMSFADAFAAARDEVGPGGVFEWHGNAYSTFYENEWNGMSEEDRSDYFATVSGNHSEEEGGSELADNGSDAGSGEAEIAAATNEGGAEEGGSEEGGSETTEEAPEAGPEVAAAPEETGEPENPEAPEIGVEPENGPEVAEVPAEAENPEGSDATENPEEAPENGPEVVDNPEDVPSEDSQEPEIAYAPEDSENPEGEAPEIGVDPDQFADGQNPDEQLGDEQFADGQNPDEIVPDEQFAEDNPDAGAQEPELADVDGMQYTDGMQFGDEPIVDGSDEQPVVDGSDDQPIVEVDDTPDVEVEATAEYGGDYNPDFASEDGVDPLIDSTPDMVDNVDYAAAEPAPDPTTDTFADTSDSGSDVDVMM